MEYFYRMKNFCGSAGEGISSEKNIVHVRFYAEPSTINSTFSILFTAFRERGSATSCEDGEFDCQDSTCISDTLVCNDRDNCKFRWDEDGCKVRNLFDFSHYNIWAMSSGKSLPCNTHRKAQHNLIIHLENKLIFSARRSNRFE